MKVYRYNKFLINSLEERERENGEITRERERKRSYRCGNGRKNNSVHDDRTGSKVMAVGMMNLRAKMEEYRNGVKGKKGKGRVKKKTMPYMTIHLHDTCPNLPSLFYLRWIFLFFLENTIFL